MGNGYEKQTYITRWIFPIAFIIWGIILYSDSFSTLWHQWQTLEYGHGLMLPLISILWGLYILHNNPTIYKPSLIGLCVIAGALILNCMGMVISNNWISNLSLVIFITGFIWTFLGFNVVKNLSPALVLLFFAVPLPVTILPALTADLQLISSSMGVNLLHLFGVSAYQEGNIIDLGDHKLDVAIACSGLQYLFPLLSLSYLIAFFAFQSWWKRTLLFLSAIPITLGMNAARIALTGILYNSFGNEAIDGPLHYIEGYMVFAACLLVLLGVVKLLNYCPPYPRSDTSVNWSFSFKKLFQSPYHSPRQSLYVGIFIVFALMSALSMFITSRHNTDVELVRKPFYDFPLTIGNWTGTKDRLSQVELQTLNLTDHFVGNYNYQGNEFAPINLYIAYYEKQSQENSIHSPQICLPGSGWVILSHDIYDVGPIQVNMEIMQKNSQRLLVYYWFREAGYNAASNWDIKKLLLLNSLKNGRTDGSLIRLTAQVNDGDDIEDVQNQMDDFLKNTLVYLPSYLPPPN